MTKLVLVKIAPWPTGRILAVLYLVVGLVVMPIMMIMALFAPDTGPGGRAGGMVAAVLMPFIYAVIGFIGGVIMAVLYNWFARLMGGIPLTFEPEQTEPNLGTTTPAG